MRKSGKRCRNIGQTYSPNLKLFGVINEIPASISKSKYFEIEKKMKRFAARIKIPPDHLDILMWAKETGVIFK